jgi:hypothetical protein
VLFLKVSKYVSEGSSAVTLFIELFSLIASGNPSEISKGAFFRIEATKLPTKTASLWSKSYVVDSLPHFIKLVPENTTALRVLLALCSYVCVFSRVYSAICSYFWVFWRVYSHLVYCIRPHTAATRGPIMTRRMRPLIRGSSAGNSMCTTVASYNTAVMVMQRVCGV